MITAFQVSQRHSGETLRMVGEVARLAALHVHERPFVDALRMPFDGREVALAHSEGDEVATSRFHATFVLELEGPLGPVGRLMLGGARPTWADDELVCDAMARVLGAALVHRRRLGRTASVSRDAHRANRELGQRVRELGGDESFVASSPAMREIARRVEILGPVPTTVLLRGETGTGKELVARRIHAHGRAGEPFVAVNCGAIPENLVESELFGHEAGAFTGATRRRRGRFELAGRGTIFLDEVGELPLASQVRLLRVLQEREVEPIGAERRIRTECRVIAATHRDLESMVADGEFRADLYYRIATYPLAIPPLRERPLDIPILVHAKLNSLARRLGRSVPAISPSTMRAICRRPFPGNVRELENLLEYALLQSDATLVIDDAARSPSARLAKRDEPTATTYDDAVRAILVDALTATAGKIYGYDGAAARLGLHPSTLQTKLARHGIDRGAVVRSNPPRR